MVDRDVNLPEERFLIVLWLTGMSTFRKNDVLVVHIVDRDVNLPLL
jgi:hypothetical protein